MSEANDSQSERLRGTSDQIVLAVQAVSVLERQKRGVAPSDPRFPTLAAEVRKAAETLLALTVAEETTAVRLSDRPDRGTLPTIEETHPTTSLAAILERWRDVERRLERAEAGSPEAASLLEEFERLRAEYAISLAEATRARERRGPAGGSGR